MALLKENINNLITDDLNKRNQNWTEIDNTFELKADKTGVTSLANKVPSTKELVTMATKNQHYPIIMDNSGTILGRYLTQVWNGSAFVWSGSLGVGMHSLTNNTGASSNGVGYNSLFNNTGTASNGFGHNSLSNNTGANSNGFGHSALASNTGVNNTAIGHSSNSVFIDNTTGSKTCNSSDVDVSTEQISITAHGFGANGSTTLVKYASTTGTPIGGLTVGTPYLITIIDANTITFSRNLTSQGTGTHTFTPSMNYSNTTCLGAYTVPNRSNQVVLGNTAVDTIKMGGTNRTPTSSTAEGVKGETCWDSNYFYICVATNTWKRTPLQAW